MPGHTVLRYLLEQGILLIRGKGSSSPYNLFFGPFVEQGST